MLPIAVIDHLDFDLHETGIHPESAPRLQAIRSYLHEHHAAYAIEFVEAESACEEDLRAVHEARMIDEVRRTAEAGGGALDPDTHVSPASYRVGLLAAGAGLTAARAIATGRVSRAFCLVRPPGHHAMPARSMGFCLFNNVAVLARYLVAQGAQRVLICDFDVHHGNGTQAAFAGDPDVWLVSMHQYPHYPMTGRRGETGHGAGTGTIINLPLPGGTPAETCVEVWQEAVAEAANACRPDYVLVSAGFDGHADDPLGGFSLEAEDFARLTEPIVQAAETYAQGRVISMLEGGYNLAALPPSVGAHLRALGGENA